MAVSGVSGSVNVKLHPLVVMNISDHWTRVRAQQGKAKPGRQLLIAVLWILKDCLSVWHTLVLLKLLCFLLKMNI